MRRSRCTWYKKAEEKRMKYCPAINAGRSSREKRKREFIIQQQEKQKRAPRMIPRRFCVRDLKPDLIRFVSGNIPACSTFCLRHGASIFSMLRRKIVSDGIGNFFFEAGNCLL